MIEQVRDAPDDREIHVGLFDEVDGALPHRRDA
jgi:hypothetical protein